MTANVQCVLPILPIISPTLIASTHVPHISATHLIQLHGNVMVDHMVVSRDSSVVKIVCGM